MMLSSLELWSLSSIILFVTHWNSSSPNSGSGFAWGIGCMYPPCSWLPWASYSATKSRRPVFMLLMRTTVILCLCATIRSPWRAVVIIFFRSLYPTSVALKCSANVSITIRRRSGILTTIWGSIWWSNYCSDSSRILIKWILLRIFSIVNSSLYYFNLVGSLSIFFNTVDLKFFAISDILSTEKSPCVSTYKLYPSTPPKHVGIWQLRDN